MTIAVGDTIPDIQIMTTKGGNPTHVADTRGPGLGQGGPLRRAGRLHADVLGLPPAQLRHPP